MGKSSNRPLTGNCDQPVVFIVHGDAFRSGENKARYEQPQRPLKEGGFILSLRWASRRLIVVLILN